MSTTARRGIANKVHFILVRDLNDLIVGECIDLKDVNLIYHYDKLKEHHRTKITVLDPSKCDESAFSVRCEWVSDRTQALDSLRKVVEAMVYGDN
jgi:hypothetical protein